jgi:transposase
MNPERAERLSPELQAALEPLLTAAASLSEQIREYDQRIEALAQQSYPEVARLKQVKGVGTLIALTFLLTLEDAHRFRKSRDVGCYLGLQPGQRNCGQSQPQMHISKEGDPYLGTSAEFAGAFSVRCVGIGNVQCTMKPAVFLPALYLVCPLGRPVVALLLFGRETASSQGHQIRLKNFIWMRGGGWE